MNQKGHFKLSSFPTWEFIKFIAALVIAAPLLLAEKALQFFKNKMKRR